MNTGQYLKKKDGTDGKLKNIKVFAEANIKQMTALLRLVRSLSIFP